MKTKSKLLIALLSVTCIGAATFGLAACGKSKTDSSSTTLDATLLSKYNAYVEDAKANNKEYYTYEQWLFSTVHTEPASTWLTGTGAPATADGNDGDLYLDTTSWDVYLKADGVWELKGNIKGANGNNGINGTDGTDGLNGIGVESISINANNEVVALYEDGTKAYIYKIGANGEIIKPETYTMQAKDTNGKAVANAYFTIYKTENYTSTDILTARTNSQGVAKFIFFPESGASYKIKSADPNEFENATPSGYSTKGVLGSGVISDYSGTADISATVSPTFYFDDITNSLLVSNSASLDIGYKRYYNLTSSVSTEQAKAEGVYEDNEAYSFRVKAGKYKYFTFVPSVSPEAYTTDDRVTNERISMMYEAAAGKYRFTITSSNNKAVLYYYSGTYSGIANRTNALDNNGIPTDSIIKAISGNAPANSTDTRYTGTNSITINFDKEIASGDAVFGIYASTDSDVVITIERIGDAEEIEVEEVVVEAKSATKFNTNFSTSDTLALAPVDGSYEAVLGDDGYYHIGSKTGPTLYVQLTNPVSRYSESYAVSYSADDGTGWSRIYSVTDDNNRTTARYYYATFISTYAQMANKAGYYPVNDELKDFLELFKQVGGKTGYSWMLPCYYIEPEGGLSLNGSGTEADPYTLHTGTNTTPITSGTYFSFTSESEGVYTFTVSSLSSSFDIKDLQMALVSGGAAQVSQVTMLNDDDICVMKLSVLYSNENSTKNFLFTGNGKIEIDVSRNLSTKDIQPVSSEGNTSSGFEEAATHSGTTPSNAIAITGSGEVFVTFDTDASPDGVYISFRVSPFGYGYYTFDIGSTVNGTYNGGYIVYNGGIYSGNELKFYAEENEETDNADERITKTYTMLLLNRDSNGNVFDGTLMLSIYKTDPETDKYGNQLAFVSSGSATDTPSSKNFVGYNENTTISLSADVVSVGVEYSFTAMETGYYKLSIVSGDNVYVSNADYDAYVCKGAAGDDEESYVFKLNSGETFSFLCGGNSSNTATEYVLLIEKTTAPQSANSAISVGQVVSEVDVSNSGYTFNLTVPTTGNYTLNLSPYAGSSYYAWHVWIGTDLYTIERGNTSVSFNLTAGTQKIIIYAYDETVEDYVNGGIYQFSITATNANVNNTISGSASYVTLTEKYDEDKAVGTYDSVYYTFTAPLTGKYTITSSDYVYVYRVSGSNGTLIIDGVKSGSFEATANEEVKFLFLSTDDTNSVQITVGVTTTSKVDITLGTPVTLTIPIQADGNVELNIDIEEYGEYQLTVTFAGSETANIGKIYVEVDGESSPSSNLVPDTHYVGAIILSSGQHTLTIMGESQSVEATITLTKI